MPRYDRGANADAHSDMAPTTSTATSAMENEGGSALEGAASADGELAEAPSPSPPPPSPAQYAMLKRVRDAMEGFVTQLQCAICLSAYDTPATLPCNHCFCEECIHRALELKPVCPICKAPTKKRRLRYDTMIQQLLGATALWSSVPMDLPSPVAPRASAPRATDKSDSGVLSSPVQINPLIAAKAKVQTEANDVRRRHGSADDDNTSAPAASIPSEAGQIIDLTETTPAVSPSEAIINEEEAVESVTHRSSESIPTTAQLKSISEISTTRTVAIPATHSNGDAIVGSSSSESVVFVAGQLVDVIDRTWRGINKPGGAAWITAVNPDDSYNVKYVIGSRKESHVPEMYILLPSEDITSQTTPSRAVKQNQRRKSSSNGRLAITPPSVDLLASLTRVPRAMLASAQELVFLCSGYTDEEMLQLHAYSDAMSARIVGQWSPQVTHLLAKCATPNEVAASISEDSRLAAVAPALTNGKKKKKGRPKKNAADNSGNSDGHGSGASRKRALFSGEVATKRWVKIRSLKYLKALVGGRWIVSEQWLQDCVQQGRRLSETSYEADGHLKAAAINAACRRSRMLREENLRLAGPSVDASAVGTRLFSELCFHIYGEFLQPMPPPCELDTLIRIGDGTVVHFMDDIALELDKPVNRSRSLVVVCDKLNPHMLKRTAKELMAKPQLRHVTKKVVSYQWLLNSISEAKLGPL